MKGPVTSVLRKMDKQLQKTAGYEPDNWQYEFRVAPSCPPDKRVHIRGGIATPSGQWGTIMASDFLPDLTCDFEDSTTTDMLLNFINANYFLPIILCYFGDYVAYHTVDDTYSEPTFDNVIGTESETAAAAEAQIDGFLNGVGQWYYYRFPLTGIVFKNDGYAGVDYAIMPIDKVNRGRSYLYRDARSHGGIYP